jgi:predicted phosphoadenosine phosphosulfate sulfurtransferase
LLRVIGGLNEDIRYTELKSVNSFKTEKSGSLLLFARAKNLTDMMKMSSRISGREYSVIFAKEGVMIMHKKNNK